MRGLLLIFGLLSTQFLFAQDSASIVSPEIIDAIKKDIWVPFMESYRDLDSKKLKSIHTADIFRVTIDNNRVETGMKYLEKFGGFIDGIKERGNGLGIAFSIMTSAIDDTGKLVYQTGYYRFSQRRGDEEELTVRGYGFFNVALRNEDGKWKISLDSDKRTSIDEVKFQESGMIYELK